MDIRQLLSRAYGGVDRFLPFDQMLDPIFAAPRVGQPQSRVPTMQGGNPQMPGQDITMSPGGIMGPGEDLGQQLQMQAPQQPQQSFAPPMRGEAPQRSPVSFGRTAWDTIVGGKSPWDSMDAQRARPQMEQQRAAMLQFASTLPPQERMVFLSDPEAWAKERAKGYSPTVVAQGSSVYQGNQFLQAPLGPQKLGPGDTLYDPESNRTMIQTPFKPEIVTTSPGETATEVTPGGGGMTARSPQVGQYILGQLQSIPGLKLGSAAPRSEAEIASLPLSARDTFHREGAALDFTAPGGNPPEVIATVRARMGPGYDVIYHPENNSYHVEPGPNWQSPGGGSRVVAQGGSKPSYTMLTPQEVEAARLPPGSYQRSPDGRIDAVGPGGEMTPRQVSSAQVQLRKEFDQNPDVKAYSDVAASYDQISRLVSAPPTAAGDISLIFSYMKMLDPGSVVREGEFATAQQAAGVPEQVLNQYNKLLKGQRLNPRQRLEFADTARTIYESRKSRYDALVGQYQGYATGSGLPPETIAGRAPVVSPTDAKGRARQAFLESWKKSGRPASQADAAFEQWWVPYAAQKGIGTPPKRASGAPSDSKPPVRVNSPAEAAALPPGTRFVTPDGRIKVR